MVDIVVGGVPPVQDKPNERQGQRRTPPEQKRPQKDRGKKEADQEVRFGVVVTLTSKAQRREGPDRSREKSTKQTYQPADF